jgi:flavin-dependent dehydrogenase
MYDIAIIGAGPAGSTLARLIADKYRVLLIDKRRLDKPRQGGLDLKCCGGLLAPDAQAMLSRMGLGLPKNILVSPQLFVVRAIDMAQNLERFYQRFYINMDRAKFDAWLISTIPAAVEKRLGCRLRSFERRGDGLRLTLTGDEGTTTESAAILVGADGAGSIIRKRVFENMPWPKRYFAIQECVKCNGQLPYFCSIFDPQITDYYCWTIPKGKNLLVGAALHPRQGAAAKFELLKRKLTQSGIKLGRTVRREGAFIFRPQSIRQIVTGTDKILLIGEAAGLISPSSAEGFSYAFKSAIALADTLDRGTANLARRFRRALMPVIHKTIGKTFKSKVIYNPLTRRIVMSIGLSSLKIHDKICR